MTVSGPGESAASPFTQQASPVSAPPQVAVPPGPGVTPPFPAPPTEGRSARLWLGLGLGAFVLVLCCGGAFAALIGIGALSQRAFSEQAEAVVGDYLDAVVDEHYDQAYRLLCDELQDRESPAEFAERLGPLEGVRSYDIGEVSLVSAEMVVPVTLTYETGRSDAVRVKLSQDSTTGEFEVCGLEE